MFNKQFKKSNFPDIHTLVQEAQGHEEILSSLIALTYSEQNLEDECSKLMSSLSRTPCIVEFHHPVEAQGYEKVKFLMKEMQEQMNAWKLIFKNLRWVRVDFSESTTVVSFENSYFAFEDLENSLSAISSGSHHLAMYSIQEQGEMFSIHMHLTLNVLKNSSARDLRL